MKKKIIAIAATAAVAAASLMTFASAESVLKGDFDRNGKITASDARSVLRCAASLDKYTEEDILICDVDNNGRITAADARLILRCSAKLENDFGSINIGETENDEKTELMNDFVMSVSRFTGKYGDFTETTLDGGVKSYKGSGVTVLSDPKMVASGKISSIIVDGEKYALCGVSVGMDSSEALSKLVSDGWTEKVNNSSRAELSKIGMILNIDIKDGKVIAVEYALGESMVNPGPTTDPSTEPSTNPSTEPSTDPSTEPSTDPSTEPSTDPTTEPSTVDPVTPGDKVAYDALPSQIKAFVSGRFGFKGTMSDNNGADAISIYTDGDNVNAGMALKMDNKSYNMNILMLKEKRNTKTYICNNDNKKYLPAEDLKVFGFNTDDLKFDVVSIDPDTVLMTTRTVKDGDTEYLVYSSSDGQSSSTEIYTIDGNIKRISSYNANGVETSRMNVDEFYETLPDDVFSLKKYSRALSIFSLFDMLEM